MTLPGTIVFLVRRQNRPYIISGATSNGIPTPMLFRCLSKCGFCQDFAHRVALALGGSFGVRIIRVAIFIKHRPTPDFLQIHLGNHRCHARRHDHAGDCSRGIDRLNDVVAHPLDIGVIGIIRNVRHVGNAVAALENLIEAAVLI